MKKLILVIVIATAAAGIYAFYMYNKPVSGLQNVSADVFVAADELYSDFENDEGSANNNYLGKIVEVKGKVRDMKKDDSGFTIILSTNDANFGINCGLSSDQEANFNKFQSGDSIILRGECVGVDMDVVMIRCVIIE